MFYHILSTHLKERPFKCAVCGRAFYQLSDCKRHEERCGMVERTLDLNDLPESSDDEEEVKPLEIRLEKVLWVQCDRCQKWRIVRDPDMTEEYVCCLGVWRLVMVCVL